MNTIHIRVHISVATIHICIHSSLHNVNRDLEHQQPQAIGSEIDPETGRPPSLMMPSQASCSENRLKDPSNCRVACEVHRQHTGVVVFVHQPRELHLIRRISLQRNGNISVYCISINDVAKLVVECSSFPEFSNDVASKRWEILQFFC